MKQTDSPIITTQDFEVSKETLWAALTDPIKMKQWYFDAMPDFKAEVGFHTSFHLSVEDRNYTHLWDVTAVTPFELIKYRWRYEEHKGDSSVTFLIKESQGKTNLTVTCDFIEDFPNDLPEFKRESGVAGWKFLIQNRLLEFLNK